MRGYAFVVQSSPYARLSACLGIGISCSEGAPHDFQPSVASSHAQRSTPLEELRLVPAAERVILQMH